VSSESKDVLDVVDRKTLTVIRRVPIGQRPNNVAITADGKRVYVCIRAESWVDIVDTASLERVKRVPVGKGPHNVYRTPDGEHMIATSMDENKLTVINIKSQEVEFEIPAGGVPRPLVIDANPDHSINRLFVQLSNLHGFAVIDWGSRKVGDRILSTASPAVARPLIPETYSHGIGISPVGDQPAGQFSLGLLATPVAAVDDHPGRPRPRLADLHAGWGAILRLQRRREYRLVN
jgi:YVTN family beta-propeller protein